MPYTPGEEQGAHNREWVFAEYATNPDGSRTKVPGTGIQRDTRSGAEISARTFNRPDQRYSLPIDEIRNRRGVRAQAELDESLAVRMDGGRVEVVSKAENRYDVNGPDQPHHCACPDFFRLQASYPDEDAVCKHILIARLKEAAIYPEPLPVGVLYVAEQVGCDYKTVQAACRNRFLPAVKSHRTWVIRPDDAALFIDIYRAKMIDPDFMAWFTANIGILTSPGRKG